jgi:segregation and condensation protein B
MPKKLIEAALFMSSRPLDTKEISKIIGINSLGKVNDLLEELRRDYEGKGIEIVKTNEGWQMQVRNELLSKVAHLSKYSDLANGHKRTLALVVYKEPIRQSEIIKIQGNKAYSYVKSLEKRGLVKTEKFGRTKLVRLTKEFERYFGEKKESIKQKLSETLKPI